MSITINFKKNDFIYCPPKSTSYSCSPIKYYLLIFLLKKLGEIIAAATIARLIFCGLACFGVASLYSFRFRSRLRELYNLPEEPCMDFCVHYWCGICAICQEHRELKNRGLDPSKGININNHMAR